MSVFVGDGTTGVEARADRLGLPTGTSDPASATAGETYYNTDTNKIRVYDGTDWADLASGGGAPPTPTPYSIDRSVRFNLADSDYLSRTPSTAGNRKTWTISLWMKRCKLGQLQSLTSSANNTILFFDSSDRLNFYMGSTLRTSTQVFRDCSAWYHIVVAFDTPNATAANRLRIYVNGNEITEWTTNVDVTQNVDTTWNAALTHQINANQTSQFGTLYLADFHSIDGQALAPTAFVEFDATTGVWNPIEYTGTYPGNSFHLTFSDNSTAAALAEDSSGNGNDWTANNLTSSIDILPAVEFGGTSSDYLSIGNDSSLTFGSGDFTIEAWMNFDTASNYTLLEKGSDWSFLSDANRWAFKYGDTNSFVLSWTPTFGQWYHVACVRNGSTVTLYIDGQSIGSGPAYTSVADTGDLVIGTSTRFSGYDFDGYVSNLRIVKGTALYTSNFTPPSTPLSAVTNTVLLCCQSSTSATNAAVTPGTITANGNVSATIKSYPSSDNDSFIDSPANGTQTDTGVGGEVRGNYCTWNPLTLVNGGSLSNGNLQAALSGGSAPNNCKGTILLSSGKWYYEVAIGSGNNSERGSYGWITPELANPSVVRDGAVIFRGASQNQQVLIDGNGTNYGVQVGTGDVIGCVLDLDNYEAEWYINGTRYGFLSIPNRVYTPYIIHDTGATGALTTVANFGQRSFDNPAPSGFKALCTANLPTPVITKPSEYMDVVTYTGNGGTQSISGLEFSPDLVWIKSRSNTLFHFLIDTVRGNNLELYSNATNAESSNATTLTAFNSDGFDLGSRNGTNENTGSYVAWTWDAGTSTVSNTDGSITSQVRANPSAGFAIAAATMPSSGDPTIGHGLGVKPDFIIFKSRTTTEAWYISHKGLANQSNRFLRFDTSSEITNNNWFANTEPTSSVITLRVGGAVSSGQDIIIYSFAEVDGYSSFGSYTGNNSSTNGTFVYTGMRPRWIMIRAINSLSDWIVWDTARDTYNVAESLLYPNLSTQEQDGIVDRSPDLIIDVLSNGFKCRGTNNDLNASEGYLYAAFAEHPFQYARAR